MKKILVVDNDTFFLEFMNDLLSKEGHKVVKTEDGLSALDYLKNNVPDIIFTDLVMPNIDGRKLCKIIRDIDELEHVHVVILSSILNEEEVDVEELGVSACITKSSFEIMTRHILDVLSQLETKTPHILPDEVIGIDRRRPRAITEELLSRKRHLEVILERMSEGIFEITSQGRIIYANKSALSIASFPEEKILGLHLTELFDEKDRYQVDELLKSMGEGSNFISKDFPIRLNEFQVTINILPVKEDNGLSAIVILNDISERKRAEDLLRSERDKFQGVLNAIGESVFIVNSHLVVEYQNEVAENRFGNSIGRKCHEAYMQTSEPCDFCLINQTVVSGKAQNIEAMHNDGRSYDIVFSTFADADGEVKVIVLQRDITDRKRLQAETMRSAHLASLGELSAGVAHEINNPINGIINYAEILKDRNEEQGEDPEIPARIIKEGDRIANIVRNLLSFARGHREDPGPVHIRDVFFDALDLMERDIAEQGINLSIDIPPDLPQINARREEIQQVFLNILSNARYALNQRFPKNHRDKKLEVSGSTVEISGRLHIRFTIRDAGTGIPAKLLDKVCNPFFSTKPKGEGTGLGLSISHGIITGYGGCLWFDSIEGLYTTAVIDLPIATDG